MQKTGLLIAGLLLSATGLHAQKPPLDSTVYGKWPALGHTAAITPDGQYVAYTIENQPVGGRTLVLQASNARWKLEIPGASGAELSADSRYAVFLKPADSLALVTLGRSAVTHLDQTQSFKLHKRGWLAYQVSEPAPALVVRNLRTGRQRNFPAVTEYAFTPDGQEIVLISETGPDSARRQMVQWVRLAESGEPPRKIWEGGRASNMVLDDGGTHLAFFGVEPGEQSAGSVIWLYRAGAARAERMADHTTPGLDPGLVLADMRGFSRDGRRLFLSLQDTASPPSPKPDAVPVHVWSYTDVKLHSEQLKASDPALSYITANQKKYLAVLRLDDRRLIRLQQEGEHLSYDLSGTGTDAFGITVPTGGGEGEENWNPAFQIPSQLVSSIDGSRRPLPALGTLSPGGKYLVYYDGEQKNFFSYELASGKSRNLTRGLTATWQGVYEDDRPHASERARGIAGWVRGDAAVLLYDRHDLWQVDPAGRRPPINLTNGYGRRHGIVFTPSLAADARRALAANERLLLSAFNLRTKDNGFYRTQLGRSRDPERLTMGPYLFHVPGNPYLPTDADFAPRKARDAEVYLVRRERANEAPNYFTTTDFRTFTRLSDLHPEQAYNWYRTELHSWPMLDGQPTQGILYKPANFDSTKRYPVIVHIYERKSDGLHAYIAPKALSGLCNINIPSYVSRGYLVFAPDIHYTVGEPGPSAVNAVVSGANYLAGMPWVDSTRLGLQGCSFGGYETNYVVTHTDLFAAAVAASSLSDYVVGYGSLGGRGGSLQGMFENGQMRMGMTLWQRPDLYIKNSPIFQADEVTAPLLLMQTTTDGVTLFPQAVEMFSALRRLGKRAWLLQYDDGDHGVWGKSADDFSVRMAQFFDHYLKGAPAPQWMTRGIRAALRGVDDGLALDPEIPTPGPGLVTVTDGNCNPAC